MYFSPRTSNSKRSKEGVNEKFVPTDKISNCPSKLHSTLWIVMDIVPGEVAKFVARTTDELSQDLTVPSGSISPMCFSFLRACAGRKVMFRLWNAVSSTMQVMTAVVPTECDESLQETSKKIILLR